MGDLLRNPYVQTVAVGAGAYYALMCPQVKEILTPVFNSDGSPKYKQVNPATLALALAVAYYYMKTKRNDGYGPVPY